MRPDFIDYLKNIGLSDVMTNIIKEKYLQMISVLEIKEFDDIFISETMSSQGSREYFSLYGFTDSLACRIGIVRGDPHIGIMRLKGLVRQINILDWNYDLITPDENSKLRYSPVNLDGKGIFTAYASGLNCSKLIYIHKKYIIPILEH